MNTDIIIIDKLHINIFVCNQGSKKFKTFLLIPSIGIIWDTQCSKGFKNIEEDKIVYGWNEFTIHIDWLNFTTGLGLNFRTNQFENE